ncbi:MAG: hypothetical protein JXA30_16515 [Deltaproteobacteria bacterium]|nr:hypothetical protein [Deltaproteobacteria bacterium]
MMHQVSKLITPITFTDKLQVSVQRSNKSAAHSPVKPSAPEGPVSVLRNELAAVVAEQRYPREQLGLQSRPLAEQIPPGRLVELSGQGDSARFTTAVSIVVQAQREGETAAWVQLRGGSLFPPDLDESGVDLDSLVVVHIAPQAGLYAIARAAELLLRSGGFGLVVLDFSGPITRGVENFCSSVWGQTAWQGRLLALAHEHQSRVVCLTDTPLGSASLGPLIGLRIESRRVREAHGSFSLDHLILKNKVGLRLQPAPEHRRAPWGLW